MTTAPTVPTPTKPLAAKPFLIYTALCVAIVVGLGWALGFVFDGPGDHEAIRVSALVALGVQLPAFAIARLLTRTNVFVGWGLGAILCFASVIIFGFVATALGLPVTAALISLATFLFVSELLEPPLLQV